MQRKFLTGISAVVLFSLGGCIATPPTDHLANGDVKQYETRRDPSIYRDGGSQRGYETVTTITEKVDPATGDRTVERRTSVVKKN